MPTQDDGGPMKALFDRVEWQPIDGDVPDAAAGSASLPRCTPLPYVTHEGVLNIAGLTVRVYQLSDGHRVIDANEIRSLLGLEDDDPTSPLWGEQHKEM